MLKKSLLIYISLLLLITLMSCNDEDNPENPLIMTSSYPVFVIISELTGEHVKTDYIVPTGASPHTYMPKPSDVKKASSAAALFYVATNLDGWVTDFPSEVKVKLIDMLPEDEIIYFDCGHDHSEGPEEHHVHKEEIDPHFWLDPVLVNKILPRIVETLSEILPEYSEEFQQNADKFSTKLEQIHRETKTILEKVEGQEVFLHHPSFNYMLERYGFYYAGAIEESPGKEPSPKFIATLIAKIKQSGVKAIFSEPQLNSKNAEVIAQEAGVNLYELNPVGDSDNMKNYRDLLVKNAEIFRKALE
ncbi:MAG: metal ABC transporter substrate-binding protein [Candidatus Kapaibacterium sp.]